MDAPEPSELPRDFGVRWLAGNGADTALAGLRRVEAKAVCALTPHPPHSKTLARGPALALVHYRVAAAGAFLVPCAVPRLRSFVKYWLPLLVWMSVIFTASSDRMSFQRSSRIIGPVVRWLFPHLSDEAVHAIVMFARKCAHLTEYAVLALLLWRALHKPSRSAIPSWRWSNAGLALALAALYAASDEIHQSFVPSRQGSVWDVLVDTAGAAFGLLCLWAVGRLRKRW